MNSHEHSCSKKPLISINISFFWVRMAFEFWDGEWRFTVVLVIWIVAEHPQTLASVDNCTVASRTNLKLGSMSPAVQSVLKLSGCILSIAFLNEIEAQVSALTHINSCCTALWFKTNQNWWFFHLIRTDTIGDTLSLVLDWKLLQHHMHISRSFMPVGGSSNLVFMIRIFSWQVTRWHSTYYAYLLVAFLGIKSI